MPELAEVRIFKALGDASRLRALLALTREELCVCQIVELLQLAPSTVSKHLQVLREAGLILSRKKGRWVHYRLNDQAERGVAVEAVKIAVDSLADTAEIRSDRKRLDEILKIDPEVLCERQKKR
jgi:DNA-binding transcriptional ArsR family regulator